MSPEEQLPAVVGRFIEDAGHLTQSFGLGRIMGQIYAFLYFSPEARTLDDMQKALSISKGSASTTVRQLEQWGAVRKVWVRGDRKDYYEANGWIGQIVRNVLLDTVGKRLAQSNGLLINGLGDELPTGGGDAEFIRERIENLRRFQTRAKKLWANPLVRKLLK